MGVNFLQLDTHVIYTSITRAFMAFFPRNVSQFSTILKSATDIFAQKNFQNTFLIPKFVVDTTDELVIEPRVVQFREKSCS